MLRSSNRLSRMGFVGLSLLGVLAFAGSMARAGVTSEEVEQAIRQGVKFLKERQRGDGSWPDAAQNAPSGSTSLVALALLTAGETPDSPIIQQALTFLRGRGPQQLNSTYAIGLQTMVFAAADPETDRARIVANVEWLERAQHKEARREFWPGNWTYTEFRGQARRQLQYAIRPSGPERRQRGRHSRQAGGLGALACLF